MKINTNSMKKQYEELLNTFCKKNHDYGNSFELSLDKYGLVAGVVRMEDKMNRLSTLVDSDTDAQIASESLVDTLMDLSNYAAMSACWLMHEDDDGLGDIFSKSNVSSAFWKPAPDDIVNEPQPFKTELKGLENGYFIRQHTNHEDSYRYTIAFNPEGTIKIQNGEEKPYVIECFGNDYDGMNVWAIHVFDTLEDMVAALNYDLKVRDTFKSKNLGDSIKGLDIKTSVYAKHDAPQVFETWIEFFGWAFDNNMKCKNLFSDGLFGISQGIKTFGPVFISEKTGALVVKGLIRERFSDRNHNFIWFSDTKEVLLELKNTVPKFNHHGIIYGINSENVNNGENYDFSPLYQDMEDNILSKFHSWDGSELKNLVFFNEDEELMSEFMEKTMQIPTDLVVEKPKNTVGTGEISVFSDMESGSLSSKNGKMELDFTDSNAYWCENTNTI